MAVKENIQAAFRRAEIEIEPDTLRHVMSTAEALLQSLDISKEKDDGQAVEILRLLTAGKAGPGPSNQAAGDLAGWRQLLQGMPPPSELASHKAWQQVQGHEKPISMCFRPGDSSALPIGLLHPVLDKLAGEFRQAMYGEGEPLSADGCEAAFHLCVEMAKGYGSESQRREAFTRCLTPYVDALIVRHHPCSTDAATDGSICITIKHKKDRLQVPVYIQEVKVEISSSGDPYFQGQRYYQLYLTDPTLAPVVRCSVLPVLFVELVGPYMRVSALASPADACVVCEPLTPFLHLFNMLHSQPDHLAQLARVLRALKRGIALLTDECGELATILGAGAHGVGHSGPSGAAGGAHAPLPVRESYLQLPYLLRPGFGFRGVEPVTSGAHNPRYRAEHEQSGRHVMVKFARVSEHAALVHRAWGAAGLAPELLEARRLPCGLTMLVMEELRPPDGWRMFYSLDPERKRQLSGAVLAQLRQAHGVEVHVDGAGARAVHCDMRQGNVMVKAAGAAGGWPRGPAAGAAAPDPVPGLRLERPGGADAAAGLHAPAAARVRCGAGGDAGIRRGRLAPRARARGPSAVGYELAYTLRIGCAESALRVIAG